MTKDGIDPRDNFWHNNRITGWYRIEDHFVDVTEMIEAKQRKRLGNAETPAKKNSKEQGTDLFYQQFQIANNWGSRHVRPRQDRVIQWV